MIAFYGFCAFTLFFDDSVIVWLVHPNRTIIASTLLLYAAFKGYRFYKERQNSAQNEQA
jgi:hypothetical protein